MALTEARRKEILEQFRTHESDTGGTEVQVALLTEDIRALTEHLKKHKKDFHTRRGLLLKVGRRNRLLRYLKRRNAKKYVELCERLGLKR